MSIIGTDQYRRGRAVAHTRAVHDPQRARDLGRVFDGLEVYFLLKLRLGVLRAVGVVLLRYPRNNLLTHLGVEAVLLEVRRREHRKAGGRGRRRSRAVAGRRAGHEAHVAGILEFLHPDRHDDVVGAGGDGIGRVANRFAARRAEIFDVRDRFVLDLERFGKRQAG